MSDDARSGLTALEPVVYRFVLRSLRNPSDARDLTQETLLHALENLAQFSARSSLKTWVLGIASHKVLDLLRARQVRMEGDDDSDLLETASPQQLERVVAARQELTRVEAALAELPARERLAVLLTDVEGLERADVCSALAVSPTHLRVILHRGRNRLRRLCERD